MKLIGMLDSPYVRRVAISLIAMQFPFDHENLSVFSNLDSIKRLNPLMKAPTFITEENMMLMDSTLILDYLESIVTPEHSLLPKEPKKFLTAQSLIGTALLVCEKTIQIKHECDFRQKNKRDDQWLNRINKQLLFALKLLNNNVFINDYGYLIDNRLLQTDITIAVTIKMLEEKLPEYHAKYVSKAIKKFSQRMENTKIFQSVYPQ